MAIIPTPDEDSVVTTDQHSVVSQISFAESMTEIVEVGKETPMDHVNVAGMDMAGVGLTRTGCTSDPTYDAEAPCDEHSQGIETVSITNGAQQRGLDLNLCGLNKRGREEGDDGRDREISGPLDV